MDDFPPLRREAYSGKGTTVIAPGSGSLTTNAVRARAYGA